MPLVKGKNSQNTPHRRKGKDQKGGEQRCRLENPMNCMTQKSSQCYASPTENIHEMHLAQFLLRLYIKLCRPVQFDQIRRGYEGNLADFFFSELFVHEMLFYNSSRLIYRKVC